MRPGTLVALILVLAGCATPAAGPSYSQPPPPAPGLATLVLFRPNYQDAPRGSADLAIDDRYAVRLDLGEYTWVHLPPGRYRVAGVLDSPLTSRPIEPVYVELAGAKQYVAYFLDSPPREASRQFQWTLPIPLGTTGMLLIPLNGMLAKRGDIYWRVVERDTPDAFVDRLPRAGFRPMSKRESP